MPGLAKTAEKVEQPTPTVITNPPDSVSRLDVSGVPVAVYDFFGTSFNIKEKEVHKLKVITDWAKSEIGDNGTEGDMLIKIRDLRNHLGSPDGLQKQYDKLFNYCRMAMHTKEVQKKMEALRRRF
jgi:hypothetical protein